LRRTDRGRRVGPRPCVIIIHIPRTGGQTLNGIVGRSYAPREILTYRGPIGESFPADDPRIHGLRVIQGHLSYGIDRLLEKPWTYMTFLREPVSRVVSLHRYIVENPRHPLHGSVREMSLADFVTSGIDDAEVENGQTRQLFGLTDRAPDEQMLEEAKRHLRGDFAAVGITERFDESLLVLRKTLGWPIPFYRVQNATTGPRSGISRDVLDLIGSRNALDRQIYAFGVDLLDERVAERGVLFPVELAAFKALNAAAQIYRRARH
jgi:hypothetical protein